MEIDPKQLPEDASALRQMVMGLLQEAEQRERKLRQLQHWVEQLLRARYGPRRERVDEHQLFLFAAAILAQGGKTPPASEESEQPQSKSASPRQGHGRGALPKSLQRQRVVYDLGEAKRQCPECQEPLKRIGEDISERLEYVPASLVVIEEACQKYACPKGCTVVTAEKPMAPIEKGLPGAGLLAHVAVSKYGDHLPLHRQEEIFQRQGVELSRQTMCGWMRSCADLASPLYELMKKRLLDSKAVQTDDTPVPVLDPDLPRTRTGRIWTYVGDDEHPYTVYDYTPNRSRDGPEAFLEEFRGYLQADAYSGYDHFYKEPERGILEVACWAHCRRRFFEAQSSDLMRSTVMLAYIRLLYDVEREAGERKLKGEARRVLRQEKSKRILDDIRAYLQREQPQVLPKSPEGEAIAYTMSNWKALTRYLDDGDLAIDNNGAERSLRGIAVGRRNWTFYGSDNGGRTAAVLTSLITTSKRLGLDPFAYLRDIFERIGAHPQSRLAELLPDQWQAAHSAVDGKEGG
ncbi:MAG TPA: IS66 family transposase [Terracidiphilus sp.]|nr:IS66 family transposase [Terracidiphilus sp.]